MTATPHDALFKSIFEVPEHAAEVLKLALPEHLATRVRWETLKHEPGSFIDPELADAHTDLLFAAKGQADEDDEVLLYVLFEHQSSSDAWMGLRYLEYLTRIWSKSVKLDPKRRLSVVIPVLLAQVDQGWAAPRRFAELFEPSVRPLAGDVLPDFSYLVHDLSMMSDEDLRHRVLHDVPRLALWLMRDVRRAGVFLDSLDVWLPTLDAIARSKSGQEAALRLLRYVSLVCDKLRFAQFRAKLASVAPTAGELAVTIAEELRAEGRAEGEAKGEARGEARGLARGRAEERARLIVRLLEKRGLSVPDDVRAKLAATSDLEQLQTWFDRALTSSSAEAIFED